MTDGQVAVDGGRSLGYAEYGDRNGWPLFYCHGFPGSRIEARFAHEIGARRGVRIIAVDRPGFGGSCFQPGRRIADWPDDLCRVADHLDIDRFSVLGVSGGGPYALACALRLPSRLRAVGVVCGLAPPGAETGYDQMSYTDRLGLRLSAYAPGTSRLLCLFLRLLVAHRPTTAINRLATSMARPDSCLLREPAIRDALIDSMREAFRSGTRGPAQDLALLAGDWGFGLNDISTPVFLWQGEMDSVVPASMARFQERALPQCEATYFPDEGHYSLAFNRTEHFLAQLA